MLILVRAIVSSLGAWYCVGRTGIKEQCLSLGGPVVNEGKDETRPLVRLSALSFCQCFDTVG